ncbi:MAG: hypothetical protein ACW99U_21620 [Candidatus Thorarchaeota archaeon]
MKITQAVYNVVKVWDLENFIEETYDAIPDIICAEEWRTDDEHVFWVNGVLMGAEQVVLDESMRTNRYGICRLYLNKLCADKLIVAGWYIVETSGD